MTICFETTKKYRGFWTVDNGDASVVHLGWLSIYTLKNGTLSSLLAGVETQLEELEFFRSSGQELTDKILDEDFLDGCLVEEEEDGSRTIRITKPECKEQEGNK